MSKSQTERILKYIRRRGQATSSELVEHLKVSRQMVARYLRELVQKGQIIKEGSTRAAVYRLPAKGESTPRSPALRLVRNRRGLEEDKVFEEVDFRLNLEKTLSPKAYRAAYYGFTEMLNNATEHSGSEKVVIESRFEKSFFCFTIRDKGVGIFTHARKHFGLQNEFEALEHLLKGKQTTDPKAHSGQGVFFTSRIADSFEIRSHKITYHVDNMKNERTVGEKPYLKGTLVTFYIKQKSRKDVADLFRRYANEDFEFDRTDVKVKLKKTQRPVARSQAKRLLAGLDKYRLITFDFAKVDEAGQGFIDEIFRVFQKQHPEVQIIAINTNAAVQFLIDRGRKELLKDSKP